MAILAHPDVPNSFEVSEGIIFCSEDGKQVADFIDLIGRGDLRLSGRPENSAADE
jgi:hypothetical protein